MTVEEKRKALSAYCLNTECEECVLKDKGFELELFRFDNCVFFYNLTSEEMEGLYALINQPAAVLENGGNDMETPTITISLERYDELIKKEVLYDELTKNKGINMYLFQDVSEPLREGANNEQNYFNGASYW